MTIDELFAIVLRGDRAAKMEGNSISAGGYINLSGLTTLPEGVTLSAGGKLYLGSVTTIPEGVTISAGGNLELGSLTTIPEGVTLTAGGNLYLDSLTTIPEGVTLSAVGYIESNHINQEWRGKTLRSVDGYLMEVISSVEVDGINLHNCRYFGKDDACRVAEKRGVFAHGATAKEAVSDLLFKLAQRDIPAVVDEIKRTGKVTRFQYRAITGACSEGTLRFLESHGLGDVEEMPLADVLALTKGAYGFEAFHSALR